MLKATLLLSALSLVPVLGLRYDRNGVTFLQDVDISIGFKTWLVISAFDTDFLQEDFILLEEMKKQMYKYIEYYNILQEEESDIFGGESIWKLQVDSLEATSKIAQTKFSDLSVYFGNIEEAKHEKRGIVTAALGIVGLGVSIGTEIYLNQIEKENNKKLDVFVARYRENLNNLNTTVTDLVNYTEDQVSFNRHILHELFQLESKLKGLETQLNRVHLDVQTSVQLQYQLQHVKDLYNDFISFQDRFLNGLVKASKGKASTPFMSPRKILEIYENFQNQQSDKSFFNKEQILTLYSLVHTKVMKKDNEIAVVHEIKVPTQSTKATLYKIKPLPLFNQDSKEFIKVKTDFPFIAVNGKSEYMLLTNSDINGCQESSSILLCDTTPRMYWTPRDTPSCESSIFFEDDELMESLCTYEISSNEEPQVTYLEEGVYHFSVAKELSVPMECLDSGVQKSQNLHLINNGFLTLKAQCTANFQGSILKNLMTENVETEILEDFSFHDKEHISNLKYKVLEELLEENDKLESLNKDDVLDSVLEKEKAKKSSILINSLFEAYNKTAEAARNLRINQEKRTKETLDTLSDTKHQAGQRTSEIILIILIVVVFVMFLAAFLFLYCLCSNQQQSTCFIF